MNGPIVLCWHSLKSPLVAGVFFVCSSVATSAIAHDLERNSHRIVVSMEPASVGVFNPFDVRVRYQNDGSAPWTLLDPETSIYVSIQSDPVQDDATWPVSGGVGFFLGRIPTETSVLPDGTQITQYFAPETREITIPPRGRHEFTIPLSQTSNTAFPPSPQVVYLKDDKEQLRSNEFKFHIVLTRSAVDRMLARVKDKSRQYPEKNWSADWLEYIHPEPRLQMRFNRGAAEDERRKRLEAEFPDRIRQWEDFWEKARDTPEMRRQLEELNGFNGVPVEIVRDMEERDDKAAAEAAKKDLSKSGSDGAPAADDFHIDVHDSTKQAASSSPPTPATVETSSDGGWLVPIFFAASLIAGGALVYRRLRTSSDKE